MYLFVEFLEHAENIFNLKLIVSAYVSFVLNVFDSGQCILVKEMKIFYFYDISTISPRAQYAYQVALH